MSGIVVPRCRSPIVAWQRFFLEPGATSRSVCRDRTDAQSLLEATFNVVAGLTCTDELSTYSDDSFHDSFSLSCGIRWSRHDDLAIDRLAYSQFSLEHVFFTRH